MFESLQDNGRRSAVERVVNDVDEVVRSVRFTRWQDTHEGDRPVQQAPRKTLYVKYKIRDNDVFEKHSVKSVSTTELSGDS